MSDQDPATMAERFGRIETGTFIEVTTRDGDQLSGEVINRETYRFNRRFSHTCKDAVQVDGPEGLWYLIKTVTYEPQTREYPGYEDGEMVVECGEESSRPEKIEVISTDGGSSITERVREVVEERYSDTILTIEDEGVWVSGMNAHCSLKAGQIAKELVYEGFVVDLTYNDPPEDPMGGVMVPVREYRPAEVPQ